MRKWIKWCIVGLIAALLAVVIGQLDVFSWQKLDLNRIRNYSESTVIYDAFGERLKSVYADENRQRASLSSVPEVVLQAFIAAEDQRFFEHRGIDVCRIFGALIHDIKTLSFAQGASTITQQLIKLTHLSGEKTLSRKAQEIVLALALEKQMDKREILECYLNTVYFGNGAYGIATAAEVYFSKDVRELTLAEGALLAGVVKAPSVYAPHVQPDNALQRRNYVLQAMLDMGAISQNEYTSAVASPIALNPAPRSQAGDWYTDTVISEAAEALGMNIDEIMTSGLHVYTAYRPDMQSSADALFENGANFPDPASDGAPVQAAFIAMQPESGEICAVVGGREYEVRRGLNRATDIRRQPGSAIKPVSCYAAAIDDYSFLPVSMIRDIQREFPGKYLPGNAGGSYYGIVTLREALSRSLNVATVDLADLIGIGALRSKMTDFGLPLSAQDVNLSLALGSMTHGVSPAQLCAAYSSLANGGMQVSPHTIRRVTDASGKLIYEHTAPNHRAVKESTAFLLSDMLKTAASSGSAKALAACGMPVAGKTGTVGEVGGGNRDIWTAAYTPDIAVCVWMGFDQSSSVHALSDSDGGSGYPARLCAAFLSACKSTLSQRDFTPPSGLVSAKIDRIALIENDRVLLAAPNTPAEYAQTEWFFENSLPTQLSDLWNAPEAVDDLTLLPADSPTLTFTAKSAAADYLILKKTGDDTQIAAVLGGNAGDFILWCDAEADPDQSASYSVLPRHRLLYQSGVVLTGSESESVKYTPSGLWNRLFGS